jgi:uncharacterized protein (TIGR00369 family)
MSEDLSVLLARARDTGEFGALVQAIPFARFLGLGIEKRDDCLVGVLRFSPHVIGNALLPALHGGAVGALLESTAIFALIWETDAPRSPKTITITIEYLRSAKTVDTWARAEITRQGRRVATVRAIAWQEDESKPVAAANAQFLLAQE